MNDPHDNAIDDKAILAKLGPVARLEELLKEAGVVVTFDPERSNQLPCVRCGEAPPRGGANTLCVVSADVVRPLCEPCRKSLGLEPAYGRR